MASISGILQRPLRVMSRHHVTSTSCPSVPSNADEAISILEVRKDTDVDMPGSMDGLKLARAIRDRWPPIELILTSGHFNLNNSDLLERGRFFPKPYRDEEIISALHGFVS